LVFCLLEMSDKDNTITSPAHAANQNASKHGFDLRWDASLPGPPLAGGGG